MKFICSIVRLFVVVVVTSTALLLATGGVFAQTVTFDDQSQNIHQISGLYDGYTWTDFGVLSPSYNGLGGGWTAGTVSPSNVGFEWDDGAPSTITASNPFALTDGYFTGAWNETNAVTAVGYVGGVEAYSTTFTETPTAPVHEYFNWSNLSSVSFTAGNSGQCVVDNLTLNPVSTPEPQSPLAVLLTLGSLTGCIVLARRGLFKGTM